MTEHSRKRRYNALSENQKAVYWGMKASLATYDQAIEETEKQERNDKHGKVCMQKL